MGANLWNKYKIMQKIQLLLLDIMQKISLFSAT